MVQSPAIDRKLPCTGIKDTYHQLIQAEIYQLKAFHETGIPLPETVRTQSRHTSMIF
ncbi:MAG: hypothetical protein M0O96_04010 [Desulforhopalus sp.]|nr:hypothetical protein [Desulforhopalus sp.]